MATFQNLQQKVFFEAKTILETLSKVSTVDELMSKQELFSELSDRVSFLKILEKNEDTFEDITASEIIENQDLSFNSDSDFFNANVDEFKASEEELIEEEVIFTNEINEIEESDNNFETASETPETEKEIFQEKIVEAAQEVAYGERVALKEEEHSELDARRRQIVEFDKKEAESDQPMQSNGSETAQQSEKKFKLAHIKGLKAMQNLFNEDPLEKLHDEENESHPVQPAQGSILKTNIPTQFMEAERKRAEFRLDLNDKVAFTKLLFKGEEAELTKTIAQLNSYDNIEDARQYLSELYYAKDWKKADEYAQRLWNLVENKFM